MSARDSKAAVPADSWLQEGSLLYRLTDGHRPENRDEINVTMADGSRTPEARARRAGELLDRIRGGYSQAAAEPEGWKLVKEAPSIADCIVGSNAVGGAVDGKQCAAIFAAMSAAMRVDSLTAALQAPALDAGVVQWRELCRRLYVELFHCDQQMSQTNNVRKRPIFKQGVTVRDVLRDAKAALATHTKDGEKT